MSEDAAKAKHADLAGGGGVLLSRGLKLLALAGLAGIFFQILPRDLALAAGIVLSWILGVMLALAKTRQDQVATGPVELTRGSSSWLGAGFLSTATLCFLCISSHFWLVDPAGLAERMEVRPQEVGWRDAAVFGTAGALVYGCLGAIGVGVARATMTTADYRMRGRGIPARREA
jgi:hypothetical protein